MNKDFISKDFIDNNFRLAFFNSNFSGYFDNSNEEEIVPIEFEHSYLTDNNIINDAILDFYHLCTHNLISDAEYLKFVETGYVGEKNKYHRPYSINILGAYHRVNDMIFKLSRISSMTIIKHRINDKEIKCFKDLEPYFIDYKKGFKYGYDNFENEKILKYLTPFPDKSDYINKVFEYITKKIIFKHNWASPVGFTYNLNINNDFNNIINGYENGLLQGQFYKAWCIVFSNNKVFEPLFINLINNKTKLTETTKPEFIWFHIGLKFANGEMEELLKTNNNNASKIATKLGNKDGYRPYISESIGVKKHTSEKSIYSDYDKMKTIIEYCKAEKTEIQSEFLMYFNKLEQEQ